VRERGAVAAMGPYLSERSMANVLNIQLVIPITAGDWNIISRTIAPRVYLPSLATGPSQIVEERFSGSHFGLGDINQSFYFSPAKPSELTWGVGLAFNLPTATATAGRPVLIKGNAQLLFGGMGRLSENCVKTSPIPLPPRSRSRKRGRKVSSFLRALTSAAGASTRRTASSNIATMWRGCITSTLKPHGYCWRASTRCAWSSPMPVAASWFSRSRWSTPPPHSGYFAARWENSPHGTAEPFRAMAAALCRSEFEDEGYRASPQWEASGAERWRTPIPKS